MTPSTREPKPLPTLEEVLAYEFDDLILRFQKDWDISTEAAEELFDATKKWLWLMAARYHDRKAGLNPPKVSFTRSTYMLDQMWHQFMLYTPQYHNFTHEFFGFFIGHAPMDHADWLAEEAEKAADPEGYRQKREAELAAQRAWIAEKLGPETVGKWYTEWATLYSEERLNAMRKPIKLTDL